MLIQFRWFDRFILLTILTNCVFLAMDDPNVPPLDYQIISDMVFQIIFTIEMTCKIIALGFMFKPYSYMRDPWNIVSYIYNDGGG
jgi:Ion transport protein